MVATSITWDLNRGPVRPWAEVASELARITGEVLPVRQVQMIALGAIHKIRIKLSSWFSRDEVPDGWWDEYDGSSQLAMETTTDADEPF